MNFFSTNQIIDSCITSDRELTLFATVDDAHDLGVVCCEFSSREQVSGKNLYKHIYYNLVRAPVPQVIVHPTFQAG